MIYTTSEIPQDQKERFKAWADKFELKTGKGASVKAKCYICEKHTFISYANSKRINFKPVCSDSCQHDLNMLKVWIGE